MNVRKDVRTRGYFSKPKEFREQKYLGNTGIDRYCRSYITD
jgi:hypothetical protein